MHGDLIVCELPNYRSFVNFQLRVQWHVQAAVGLLQTSQNGCFHLLPDAESSSR